jgi:hypothetical protein
MKIEKEKYLEEIKTIKKINEDNLRIALLNNSNELQKKLNEEKENALRELSEKLNKQLKNNEKEYEKDNETSKKQMENLSRQLQISNSELLKFKKEAEDLELKIKESMQFCLYKFSLSGIIIIIKIIINMKYNKKKFCNMHNMKVKKWNSTVF